MNIDELRTVQTKERQKDSLQHLRDSFYEDVADYIRDLKAERDDAAAAADDPFSDPEVSRFTDEIETAEEVVEAIYERRVGKVVKLSSFAAADMPVNEEGLTAQERDLFEDLVARIGENKGRVLDILAGAGDSVKASPAASPTGTTGTENAGDTEVTTGERPAADETQTASDETPVSDETPTASDETPVSDETPTASDETPVSDETPTGERAGSDRSEDSPARSEPAFGAGDGPDRTAGDRTAADDEPPTPPDTPSTDEATEVLDADDSEPRAVENDAVQPSTPPADPETTEASERTTVRVTADVGRVLGVDDREYDLRNDDVVDLPADNADALLQRNAAEKLE